MWLEELEDKDEKKKNILEEEVVRLAPICAERYGNCARLPLRLGIIKNKRLDAGLIVFLVVYSSDQKPFMWSVADQIQQDLEKSMEDVLKPKVKCVCRVSQPFPYLLLD